MSRSLQLFANHPFGFCTMIAVSNVIPCVDGIPCVSMVPNLNAHGEEYVCILLGKTNLAEAARACLHIFRP